MSAVFRSPLTGLRPMRYEDLSSVMAIEERAYWFPWTRAIFGDCLRVGYPAWVYHEDETLTAYCVTTINVDECHILNLCVSPDAQGRGIGRSILRAVIEFARSYDLTRALLEVRPSNGVAVHLYRSEGFEEIGRRKDYYPAPAGREDALMLARRL